MKSIERKTLVAYFAAEFERRADAQALTTAERRELVLWLKDEFRRLARAGGDKHGCVYVDRRRYVVRVRKPQPQQTMSLPACLRTATTEANLARLGLPRAAWVRMPRNEERA